MLAPFLAEWIQKNPNVRLTAVEGSSKNLVAKVRAGDCDAAIIEGPIDFTVMDSLRITTAHVIAVFPPGHPIGISDEPLHVSDLVNEPLHVSDLVNEPLLVNGAEFPSTVMLLEEFVALNFSTEHRV